jgi:NitT/TauT family transport system permease protein
MRTLFPQYLASKGAPIVVLVVLVVGWEALVRVGDISPYVVPGPYAVASRLALDLNLIFKHAGYTAAESMGGFALATILGTLLAVAMQMITPLNRALNPIVAALQSTPKEAMAPLLVVYLGFGWPSKVVMAASIAFFPIYVSLLKGLASVPEEVTMYFQATRVSSATFLYRVRIPYSLPFVFAGFRVASTLSVVGATIAEFVGSSAGLGHLILVSNAQFAVDRVFACLIVLGLMGLAFDFGIRTLERYLIPWHESVLSSSSGPEKL